jgi:hypothetical protein
VKARSSRLRFGRDTNNLAREKVYVDRKTSKMPPDETEAPFETGQGLEGAVAPYMLK